MIEIGATDGPVVGTAGDEIFAERIARVDTGEQAEVFLFGEEAAVEEGEARDGEGVGRDGRGATIGAEDEASGGVALEVQCGIAARAGGLDVGLLSTQAGDDFEATVEEGGVAAEEGGGDRFLGVFGIVYGGAILGVGIDGEMRGRGDGVGVELGVADPVDLGKAERRDALGEIAVDELRGALGAGVRKRGGHAAGVALGDAHIEAGLEREGHAPREIAGGVDVGGLAAVAGIAGIRRGVGDGLGVEAVGVERSAGDAVGDGDATGAEVEDIVERDGEIAAHGGHVVEETEIDIAVRVGGAREAEAALGFPHGAGVAPREGRHGGAIGAVDGVVERRDVPGAGAAVAVREGRREVAGENAADGERQRAGEEIDVVLRGLKSKREAVAVGETVVDARAEGRATGFLEVVAHGEIAEVGFVGSGVGEGSAIGRRAGAAPRELHKILRGKLRGVVGGEGEAEAFVDGYGVGEIETGVDLAARLVGGAGGFVEVAVVVARHEEDAALELGAGAFESGARDHIHGAREGGAGGFGRGRVEDLDARDVIDGDEVEGGGATGATDAGAGKIEAADGDGDVAARGAADGDVAGIAATVVDGDAGHEFEQLGDVALGDLAEFLGRNDVFDFSGEALLVDGERGAVHARHADHKRIELDHARARRRVAGFP